ncbi:unnamed protein product [Auanema sp. JU1783]|nr:unnamed protein product [Auanema sp. JU1783]
METMPCQQKMWDWPLQHNDEFVSLVEDENHFEVGLDAKPFGPNEIEVKTIGDLIEIHLEHKAQKGMPQAPFTSRSITRCYQLPKDVNVGTLKSNIDHQGVLHISAMKCH